MTTTGRTLPANVADALRHVLDYLLDDEAAHYRATSPAEGRQNHIYPSLRLLDTWIGGCQERAQPTPQSVDLFGKCPKCGRNDGFLNVGDAHWFVCHVHGICWCVGSNLFPCWRFEDRREWHVNRDMLSPYESVDPQYRVLTMASPAWMALRDITAYLREHRSEQGDEQRRQILGCLQDLDEWFNPETPDR